VREMQRTFSQYAEENNPEYNADHATPLIDMLLSNFGGRLGSKTPLTYYVKYDGHSASVEIHNFREYSELMKGFRNRAHCDEEKFTIYSKYRNRGVTFEFRRDLKGRKQIVGPYKYRRSFYVSVMMNEPANPNEHIPKIESIKKTEDALTRLGKKWKEHEDEKMMCEEIFKELTAELGGKLSELGYSPQNN
jgi:hypothetical protein